MNVRRLESVRRRRHTPTTTTVCVTPTASTSPCEVVALSAHHHRRFSPARAWRHPPFARRETNRNATTFYLRDTQRGKRGGMTVREGSERVML